MSEELEIRWSPAHQVGHPTIAGTRLRPEDIAGRIWAGEPLTEVADDYGISVQHARLACWFIARWPYASLYGRRRPQWQIAAWRSWGDWAHDWHASSFWPSKIGIGQPCDPPVAPKGIAS